MTERPYTIDAEGAYLRYVGLGADRSLKKLAATLAEDGQPVPLKTLERWSAAHDWQARLRDATTAERATTDLELRRRFDERRSRYLILGDALVAVGGRALLATPSEELKPADAVRR